MFNEYTSEIDRAGVGKWAGRPEKFIGCKEEK